MLTGLALIAAETFINHSKIRDAAESWYDQPLVIAVGIAVVAQAVAVSVFVASCHQRRWALASITLLGLAAAVAFTFSTTYERTADARQARSAQADLRNAPQRVAASRVASATARRDAECQTRGAECRKCEAEVAEVSATYAAQPKQIGVQLLGQLDFVPDLALPVMLMLLGFAFIAFVDEPVQAASIVMSFPASK